MASWDYDMVAFVKGDPEEAVEMRKRLSVILENQDKLEDADWIRELFGDELSEITNIGDELSDDDVVSAEFDGFTFNWDSIDIDSNPLSFSASDKGSSEPNFAGALMNCFPRVEFKVIATGYISWGCYIYYFDDDFSDETATMSWEGSEGEGVLNACKEWRYAEAEEWLLPDDTPKEERAKAQQKKDNAETVFAAFEYAYHNFDTEEGILTVTKADKNYYCVSSNVPITASLLSVIYEHFGDVLKVMDFSEWGSEDVLDIPENIAKAVKDGKLTLEGR